MHKLVAGKPGDRMLILGNEAIVRGALEAGIDFATTYPGTPSTEIGDNFYLIAKETDLYFEYSSNEKVALEVAAAASASGLRSMCSMKHIGVNAAADPLMALAYLGVEGSLVLVSADDPNAFSSGTEQDNRLFAKLANLPVLEPSSIQEAKDMAVYAFDLSEELGEPVFFRTTTRISHSSGVVTLGPIKEEERRGDFVKDPTHVLMPVVVRMLRKRMLANLDRARAIANESAFNKVIGDGKWGIITNGVSFNYVMDAIKELDKESRFRILRLGFSYPFPDILIKNFVSQCEKVLVVEEGEPFMEEGVKALAQEIGSAVSIKGKGDELIPPMYELDPVMVTKAVAHYFGIEYSPKTPVDSSGLPETPGRPPILCAGCPHRASFAAIRQVLGDDAIYASDIGCYALGVQPPLNAADFIICMGSSIGLASGFSTATGKKAIGFIGDSTFFHSGLSGLASAVYNQHDMTLVILDNGTTAMTGHQPHAGAEMVAEDPSLTYIPVENAVRGLGVSHVLVVNPLKMKQMRDAIREAVDFKGVSVIISRAFCPMLPAAVRKKEKKRAFYVNEGKCKNHRDCLNILGCPAFYVDGDRVKIDEAMCTGCAVCAQVCPENAILPKK